MQLVESELNPARCRYAGQVTDTGAMFWALADQSLFQSMSESGIAWPVSCRNGTCRTCLGRLTEGQVVYDTPWPGLSAEEKRDGYCLPCIARPVGPVALTRT